MNTNWKIGDWAYMGYELVQIKEMTGKEVHCVTTGFIQTSGAHFEERLFPQSVENKRIAKTIEIYYDRLRNAKGASALNHPDINRKFEDFAWRAMSAQREGDRKAIMDEASAFQRTCAEKMQNLFFTQVDDVYIFGRR